MNFRAVLIEKSADLKAQAEQLYGFINSFLKSEDAAGSTVFLTGKTSDPRLPLNRLPTAKVELVRVPDCRSETILNGLQMLDATEKADLYLFPNGVLEHDVVVRWACRANGSSLVQVKTIDRSETEFRAKKSVYADHVLAAFRMTRRPYCISLAKDGVEAEPIPVREKASIVEHDLNESHSDRQIVSSQWIPETSASDLESAPFLVVGGRGVGSAAACRRLQRNAAAMGAAFGVSRPVAMSGWAPMNRLVGASGAIARPEICIAAGVSGAAAFYAGIAKSKKIVAINTDARAPIVKAADVVIIDDYETIVEALVRIVLKVKKNRSRNV